MVELLSLEPGAHVRTARILFRTLVLSAVMLLSTGCEQAKQSAESGAQQKKDASGQEAMQNLGAIAEGADFYFQVEHTDPSGQSTTSRKFPRVPSFVCTAGGEAGKTVPPDATNWMDEPWKSLGFAMTRPFKFSYCYESSADGEAFAAWAESGDLAYCVTGKRDGAKAVISPVRKLGAEEECLF